MDKKNRELAKKNTELLEEISRLTDIHSDMLKEQIKEKYYRTRGYNKLVEQVERQIKGMREMVEESLFLRKTLIGLLGTTDRETTSSPFKQTLKILNTLCKREEVNNKEKQVTKERQVAKKKEDRNENQIKNDKQVLKEKNPNNPQKRRRVTRK